MAIFTSLSTFKRIRLTCAKICAGCGREWARNKWVLAKSYRNPDTPRKIEKIFLCPDSPGCWQEFDWRYWENARSEKIVSEIREEVENGCRNY